MTLESLEILPRGADGWGSGPLRFGRHTTLLLGPNGTGKTPVLKALSYALGHPVELPALVREKCQAVRLDLRGSEGKYRVERQLTSSGVVVTITDPSGRTAVLNDERTLSEWVLPKIGIKPRPMVGTNGDSVPPYMSVIAPMFLVDQDIGWTNLYVPFDNARFVKSQREEMVRWLLDVPAKHRPVSKIEFREAKTALAGIQEEILFKRRGLERLQRELGEDRAADAMRSLEERRGFLETELVRAYSFVEGFARTDSTLDVRLREAVQQRDQLRFKLANANRLKAHLIDVQAEVTAELGAIEQNEIAADAFRSLCGKSDCQFFRKPEDSYGRRVLYLKDQLKDFESSVGETARELEILQQQLAAAEASVQVAADEKTVSLERQVGHAAVTSVQELAKELADVRVRLDRLERIARERQQLEALLDKEQRASEDVAELKPTGGGRKDSSRLLDARQNLGARFKEWMLTLHTPNVPADASLDDELRLTIGGAQFSAKSEHSGSTRTRIVLAFHAAMVETSLLMEGVHPRLLVLDAPKQHELAAQDLRSFIRRFYEMSAKQADPVQLVYSATDASIVPDGCADEIWKPLFECDADPYVHYLGPPARNASPAPR
jgi:hypothetical protein